MYFLYPLLLNDITKATEAPTTSIEINYYQTGLNLRIIAHDWQWHCNLYDCYLLLFVQPI